MFTLKSLTRSCARSAPRTSARVPSIIGAWALLCWLGTLPAQAQGESPAQGSATPEAPTSKGAAKPDGAAPKDAAADDAPPSDAAAAPSDAADDAPPSEAAPSDAAPSDAAPSDAAEDANAGEAAATASDPDAQNPEADVEEVNTASAAPSTADPDPELAPLDAPFRFEVFTDTVWNTDPGFDLFSEDDVEGRFGLMLGLRVAKLAEDVDLSLLAGYSSSVSSDGELAPEVFHKARLIAHHPQLSLLIEHSLLPWFGIHARGHGGASFVKTRLYPTSGQPSVEQDDLAPFFGAGGGFSIETQQSRLHPTRSFFNSAQFGIRVEGGYVWASALSLALDDLNADPPDQRVDVRGASLGTLDRNGPYLTLGAFLRM